MGKPHFNEATPRVFANTPQNGKDAGLLMDITHAADDTGIMRFTYPSGMERNGARAYIQERLEQNGLNTTDVYADIAPAKGAQFITARYQAPLEDALHAVKIDPTLLADSKTLSETPKAQTTDTQLFERKLTSLWR